ncbi:hypothetical protein NUU61_009886 [Penicillium alfredii]|uniref:Uncharacterized protein n=1 Tax=Penicillium alfredii TaxID=1506179 RepID=A0A9W9EH48_9EURO|nr:uncharacterized protein NUU61_009886 [Penicillium alfredii]KAJ5081622.1 hypothetical protein NUU61_009886 [Penicillium alfredii]
MKRQQPHNLSEIARDQFRTPSRPSPLGPAAFATSKSTSKRRRSPDSAAPTRIHKRSSLPSGSRAQPTLTQIDFVTQPTDSDEDQLDYIDEFKPRGETETQDPAKDDDSDDADYETPRARSARISKFGMNHPARASNEHPKKRRSVGIKGRDSEPRSHGLRKSETPRASIGAKSRRKSLEKSNGKPDKTLTQMDFVRRYITIDDDDDDDVNMGYIQQKPTTDNAHDEERKPMVESKEPPPDLPPLSAKRNPRVFEEELDLSTGEPISQSADTQEGDLGQVRQDAPLSGAPATPQKPRRLEVPSSQSPESPGLAIITSSQFRGVTRSPLKQKSLNLPDHLEKAIKEESPQSEPAAENSHHPEDSLNATTAGSSTASESQNLPQPTSAAKTAVLVPPLRPTPQGSPEANGEPTSDQPKRERTVVYETDAETDYGDFDERSNDGSETPSPGMGQREHDSSPGSPKDDSQELPLPPVQSTTEPDSAPPSNVPMSDASICYQRMHPATQFPHEPIPALNTQKLSELFPHESSTQYPQPEPPRPLPQEPPAASLQTQTQTQTQSQTQNQTQGEKVPTEFVPESSPTRERESSVDVPDASFSRPRVLDSVVQVESSQPVDWGSNRPRGILSRSQLLTSSVMESVPLPNFWTGSQDSVGEPYSLPDAS